MANGETGEVAQPSEQLATKVGSEEWYADRHVILASQSAEDLAAEAQRRLDTQNPAALHELLGVLIVRGEPKESALYATLASEAVRLQPALLQIITHRLSRPELTASPSDIAVALSFIDPALKAYRMRTDKSVPPAMTAALGAHLATKYKIPEAGNPLHEPSLRVAAAYHLVKGIDSSDHSTSDARFGARRFFKYIAIGVDMRQVSLPRNIAHYHWLNSLGEGFETPAERERRRQRTELEEKSYAVALESGVLAPTAYKRMDFTEDDKLILWNSLVTQAHAGSKEARARMRDAKLHLEVSDAYALQLLRAVQLNRCSAVQLQAVLDARTKDDSLLSEAMRTKVMRVVSDFARPHLQRIITIGSPESWWTAENALHQKLEGSHLAQRATRSRLVSVKKLFPR